MSKKTKRIVVGIVVLLLAVTALVWANYDKVKVVAAMREAGGLVGKTQTALKDSDFAAAEENFKKYAAAFAALKEYTPLKGTKADWDKVLDSFVSAAEKGAKAAAAKDAAGAGEAMKALLALRGEGHSKFR